VSQIAMKVNKK